MTNKEKWSNALVEYVFESGIIEKAKETVCFPYVKLSSVETKTQIREKIQCPHCFEIFTVVRENRDVYREVIKCNHCGREFCASKSTGLDEQAFLTFGDEKYSYGATVFIDVGVVCGIKGIVYVHLTDASAQYKMKEKRIVAGMTVNSFGFLHPDYRFYYRQGAYTTCSINTYLSNWCGVKYTQEAFDLLADWSGKDYPVDFRNAMYNIQNIERNARTSSAPERSFGVKRGTEIDRENPVCDVSELKIGPYSGILSKFISYNKMKNKSSYSAYCYKCKRTFRYQDYGRYGSKVHKCPHCGFEGKSYDDGSYHYEHELHIDVCKNGDIVFRVIKVELKAEKTQLSATAEETHRIYIRRNGDAPKRDVLYYDSLGNIRYRKSGELPSLSLDRGRIHISDEANEIIKHSGFVEYIENKLYGDRFNIGSAVKYLSVWLYHPVIEKFIKLGWRNLTDDLIQSILAFNRTEYNEQGKGMHNILGINKTLFRYLLDKRKNPNSSDLKNACLFYQMDPNVTKEDLCWCSDHSITTHTLKEIVEMLGISVRQACEYLERVRVSQCFPPSAAATQWRDYLKACQTIEADLSDKTVRYPSSLKREHDKAVFKQKIIFDQQKEEIFQKTCRKYEEEFRFEDEQYQIIAPSSMQDLFEEGRKLHHCVGSYADRIIEGYSCICFIRKKENPEIPFFTMEICKDMDRVTQIHGLSNRHIDPKRDVGLKDFLKVWAKKNKLALPAA